MAEESSSIDKVLSGEMKLEYIDQLEPVSYTHLTLPTNREV